MTSDAQALAPVLAKLAAMFRIDAAAEFDAAWLPDATGALEWVAATLHTEGDVGDALRERLGLRWKEGGRLLQTNVSAARTHRRLVSLWEPKP